MEELDKIFASDAPDIEKLTQAFAWITRQDAEHTRQEIELLKAINDDEELVKEQIKLSTLKYVRNMYQFCYLRVTGKKAWDEPIN
jgi:hypothetical protein